jgi:uncharacterized SAM-binding protein YcdF (DUF218 family)
MSFILPRLIWLALDPLNVLLVALCLGALLLLVRRWRPLGLRLLATCGIVAAALSVLPVGRAMLAALEYRFPAPASLPEHVDGIILLGGAVDLDRTRRVGLPAVSEKGRRLVTFARLASRYPRARLVFSGGNGSLFPDGQTEAEVSRPLLTLLGVDTSRIVFENRSRTTYENAVLSRRTVQPQAGETWLLVTSAYHMPRAVGVFRKLGWPVVAVPSHPAGGRGLHLGFNLLEGLNDFRNGCREWLGLIAYWLMGRTSSLLPAPEAAAASPAS